MRVERIGTAWPLRSAFGHYRRSRKAGIARKVLKSLLRELSHRSKNLLAIIQGIATQTARYTLSLDSFLVKFRGRLQSLSHSQDLITDSSWRGAYLFELAEKQFAPYWPDSGVPMPIYGINAHLSPNAAVHLGLALHELIVNSATPRRNFGRRHQHRPELRGDLNSTARRPSRWHGPRRVFDPAAAQEFEDNSFAKTRARARGADIDERQGRLRRRARAHRIPLDA